ncbi:MAG: NUDIX domain-containing protein [Bacteroidota bacterium]
MKEKVLAYILRQKHERLELLTFEHIDYPDAGIQVPGGSIDPGERAEAAVLREVFEEAGLEGFENMIYLGVSEFLHPKRQEWQRRHFYQMAYTQNSPDTFDFIVQGTGSDHGLGFRYLWRSLDQLPVLEVQQGEFLHLLKVN